MCHTFAIETTDFNCNAENEIDHRLSELKDTIGASMAWVDEGGGLETLVAQDKMRISELESQFESLQSGVSFISKVLQVGEHLKSTDAVLDKFDYSKAVDQSERTFLLEYACNDISCPHRKLPSGCSGRIATGVK